MSELEKVDSSCRSFWIRGIRVALVDAKRYVGLLEALSKAEACESATNDDDHCGT